MAFTPGMNPIQSVDGKACPCPSEFGFEIQDASAPGAGRTEDVKMHKKRIGQTEAFRLVWAYPDTQTQAKILQLFDKEYFTVTYVHPKLGDFTTDEFYVGDRSGGMYNSKMNCWLPLSFSIIRRSGTIKQP